MSKESREAAEARGKQKVHEVAEALRKEVHNQHDSGNPLKDSLAAIHAERKKKS